jgi:hypothetical protein
MPGQESSWHRGNQTGNTESFHFVRKIPNPFAQQRRRGAGTALKIGPLYVDTIICRCPALTGDSARHMTSGRTFNELEAEVEQGHEHRKRPKRMRV